MCPMDDSHTDWIYKRASAGRSGLGVGDRGKEG